MKKKLFIFTGIIVLALSGCSGGVSQDDYQAIVTENEALKGENESLEQVRLDLVSAASGQADDEVLTFSAAAWARTSFGEGCVYLFDYPNYMQCIVEERYSSTPESVSLIWEDFKLAAGLLPYLSEEIVCEKIAVKYLSDDETVLVEFVLKREDGNYSLDSIAGDLTKADLLVSSLGSTR